METNSRVSVVCHSDIFLEEMCSFITVMVNSMQNAEEQQCRPAVLSTTETQAIVGSFLFLFRLNVGRATH